MTFHHHISPQSHSLVSISTPSSLAHLSMQSNPSDILLFHKRRQAEAATSGKGGASKKKRRVAGLDVPLEPEDLEQINIEDLIQVNLANSEKKLEILDEKGMGEGMNCSMIYLIHFLDHGDR